MPYKISKVKGGEKVVSPNHPKGFSKQPQSHAKAAAQMRAIQANTKDEGEKGPAKPHHQVAAEKRAGELRKREAEQKKEANRKK
jgi:hypothetical protein